MRRNWPKSEPESKPAALDVAGFDKLEASLNELSKAAATQSLTYLLLWLYLAFTVASVTDYDLLIENPIKLPIFNLEIGLIAFFIAAPPLFWLVQLYMVRKLAVIGEAVVEYLAAARQQAESAGVDSLAVLERLRHRADGFVITRLLARFDDIVLSDGRRGPPSSDLAAALTVLAAGATLIVAPLLLYFGFQIRFLAYQSEFITWWHRGWVLAGLMLCAAAGRTAKLSWGESFAALSTLRRHVFRLGGARWLPEWAGLRKWLAAIKPVPLGVFLSFFVLTFPGEFMSDGVVIENRPVGGWLAELVGVPRTLTPQAPFDREAVTKAFNDNGKLSKLDLSGAPPLDLRHRDFSYRSLRGVNFVGAWLQRSNFLHTQLQNGLFIYADLQDAYLWEAKLQGANLREAHLQNVKFWGADLQGAVLEGSRLEGAYFWDAQMQGADLNEAQLQAADFMGAALQGTDFRNAQLNGGNFSDANLNGANFEGANFKGAILLSAQLQGANLAATTWWRASVDGVQLNDIYFTPPPEGDTNPDSPEKYRPLVVEWRKYVKDVRLLSRLTDDGDPYHDAQTLNKIYILISDYSSKSNPQQRAYYLVDMVCRHEHGKWIISNIISRSNNRDDVSAAALSDRLKDADRCPAARELSADDWKSLARNVEQEKAAASRHQPAPHPGGGATNSR